MHGRPDGSKVSRYETAKQVQKQIGREPQELLLAPELPDVCAHLWGAYTRLSSYSYQEVEAYTRLTGDLLDPWEIDAIIGLSKIAQNPPSSYKWQMKQR